MALHLLIEGVQGFLLGTNRRVLRMHSLNSINLPMKETPVFYTDMTPEQRKAFRAKEREEKTPWWLGSTMEGSVNRLNSDRFGDEVKLEFRQKIYGAQ